MIVTGVFGHSENRGSTPKALEIILSGLPRVGYLIFTTTNCNVFMHVSRMCKIGVLTF